MVNELVKFEVETSSTKRGWDSNVKKGRYDQRERSKEIEKVPFLGS